MSCLIFVVYLTTLLGVLIIFIIIGLYSYSTPYSSISTTCVCCSIHHISPLPSATTTYFPQPTPPKPPSTATKTQLVLLTSPEHSPPPSTTPPTYSSTPISFEYADYSEH